MTNLKCESVGWTLQIIEYLRKYNLQYATKYQCNKSRKGAFKSWFLLRFEIKGVLRKILSITITDPGTYNQAKPVSILVKIVLSWSRFWKNALPELVGWSYSNLGIIEQW